MLTKEEIDFHDDNADLIKPLIDLENDRRNMDGLDFLTNEEIYEVIRLMFQHTKGGNTLGTFAFPGREPMPTISKRLPRKDAPPSPKPVTAQPKKNPNSLVFEIDKGANGHVLRMQDGKFFIFRTPKELLKVIEAVVFEPEAPKISFTSSSDDLETKIVSPDKHGVVVVPPQKKKGSVK